MEIRILSILRELHPENDYGTSSDFLEDGLLDSIDVIMITGALEEEFCVSIPGEKIVPANYSSVGALTAMIVSLPVKSK